MATQEQINNAIKKYKEEQRQRSLSRVKKLAQEQGKTSIVKNIEGLQGSSGGSSSSSTDSAPEEATQNQSTEIPQGDMSSTNIQQPNFSRAEPTGEVRTAEVKITNTGEQVVQYDDGRQIRLTTNPYAEVVRQGGQVEFKRGAGGRPQVSKITPPKDAKVLKDKEGNVVGYELKPSNPVIRESDAVRKMQQAPSYQALDAGSPKPEGKLDKFIYNLRDYGQRLDYQADSEYAKLYAGEGTFPEVAGTYGKKALGQSSIFIADNIEGFKETIKKPSPYIVAGGLTLLATKNPALASKVAQAGTLLIPFYVYKKAEQIGKGETTLGKVTGETGAYVAIGYATSKTIQGIRKLSAQREIKVVGQGGATRSYKTDTQTISQSKSNTIIKGSKGTDYTVKSDITQTTPNQEGNTLVYSKGTGKYKILDTKTGKELGAGTLDTRSILNTEDQKALSLIKVKGDKDVTNLVDYTLYKNLDATTRKELSILFKAKGFTYNDLLGAKPTQLSKGITQDVVVMPVYSESGKLIGVNTRSIFIKGGIGSEGGVNQFFKFEVYKPPQYTRTYENLVTDTGADILSTQALQQNLAKNVIINKLAGTETLKVIPLPDLAKPTEDNTLISKKLTREVTQVSVPKVASPKELQAQKTRLEIISQPKTRSEPTTRPKTRSSIGNIIGSLPKIETGAKQIIEPIQKPAQIPSQIQAPQLKQPQAQATNLITTPVAEGFPEFIIPAPKVPAPSFPKGFGGDFKGFKAKAVDTKTQTRYTPTTYSAIQDIKAPKLSEKIKLGTTTGLGVRPVIEPKKSSKKNKKKGFMSF